MNTRTKWKRFGVKVLPLRAIMLGFAVLSLVAVLTWQHRELNREIAKHEQKEMALQTENDTLHLKNDVLSATLTHSTQQVTALKAQKVQLTNQISEVSEKLEDLRKTAAAKAITPAVKRTIAPTATAKKTKSTSTAGGAWKTFKATAYTARCTGCSGITATGYDVRDTSVNHRVIAVDPRVIPLYSIVEIEGQGYFKAVDTGGAIKGRRIDVLVNSSRKAIQFGRQDIRIRVIRSGKGVES